MVKAYLRYVYDGTSGAVCGNQCRTLIYNTFFIGASAQCLTKVHRKSGEIESIVIGNKNIEITSICLIDTGIAIGYQDGDIILWQLETKTIVGSLYGHSSSITSLIYQDDVLYSGSMDNSVILWDVINQEVQLRLRGHTNAITSLNLINLEDPITSRIRTYLISAGKDGILKVWDLLSEVSIHTLSGNASEILCLEYIEKEQILIIASNSENLQFKKIGVNFQITDQGDFKRVSFQRPVQIQYDNLTKQLLVLSKILLKFLASDKKIEVYRVRDQKKVQRRQKKSNQEEEEQQLNFSQLIAFQSILTLPSKVRSFQVYTQLNKNTNQVLVILSYANNSMEVREIISGCWKEQEEQSYVLKISGNTAPIKQLYLSDNDQHLLALSGNECVIYEPEFMRVQNRVIQSYKLTACCFLTKNRYFLLGDQEGNLSLRDINSGLEVQSFQAHQTVINNITYHTQTKYVFFSIIFRPNNQLVILTSGQDQQIKFWEILYSQRTKSIQLIETKTIYLSDQINYVSFSARGDYYAVSLLSSTIQLFYCDSHKLYMELYGHALPVLQFGITSDDTLIISGSSDKNIKIWGMDFGDCKKTLKAHQDQVSTIKIVNETHYFFSGGKDRIVKYWDGDTYQLVMQFEECITDIQCISVGVIGDIFFVGGQDRIIRKYRQTKEQVFVAEEDERISEKLMLEEYQKNNQIKEGENQNEIQKGQVFQNKLPHLRQSEDLMKVLDDIRSYRVSEEIDEEPDENKLVLFNNKNPTSYLFEELQIIPSSTLPSVLKFMHVKYIPILVKELSSDIAIKLYPIVTSAILNHLIIHEGGMLMGSASQAKDLLELKDKLQKRLNQQNSQLSFNLVAADALIRSLEESEGFDL